MYSSNILFGIYCREKVDGPESTFGADHFHPRPFTFCDSYRPLSPQSDRPLFPQSDRPISPRFEAYYHHTVRNASLSRPHFIVGMSVSIFNENYYIGNDGNAFERYNFRYTFPNDDRSIKRICFRRMKMTF